MRSDLPNGSVVRFRRRPGGTWKYGTAVGQAKDGSISIYSDGKAAAIPPQNVEVKARGPRGGTRWAPLTDQTGPEEEHHDQTP